MSETIIGLDLAKNVFQVHGLDAAGKPVLRKRLGGTSARLTGSITGTGTATGPSTLGSSR